MTGPIADLHAPTREIQKIKKEIGILSEADEGCGIEPRSLPANTRA
jgi:hypothetical protein